MRHFWIVFSFFKVIFAFYGNDSQSGENFGQIETFLTSEIWYPWNFNLHLMWDPEVESQDKSKIIYKETDKDSENTSNLSNYNNVEIFLDWTIFSIF